VRNFAVLHLRYLTERVGRSVLAVAAVAAAASLVMALVSVQGSLIGSVRHFEAAVAGTASLEVTGLSDTGIDEGLVNQVRHAPGVATAAPLVLHRVVADRIAVDLVGIDPSLLSFDATELRNIARQLPLARLTTTSVVVGPGIASALHLHVGSVVHVAAGDEGTAVHVAAILRGGEAGSFDQGEYLATGLPYAQQLAGMTGRVDDVLVASKPGADLSVLSARLTSAIGPTAVVESPAQLTKAVTAELAGLLSLIPVIGAAVTIVALFLVFNTVSMLALERRRELATLRALGASRRTLLFSFVLQAGFLGAVGSAIGIGVGAVTGRWLVESAPPALLSPLPVGVTFAIPAIAPLAAVGAGVVGSVLAAWLPGRQVSAVAPTEAMRPDGVLEETTGVIRWRPLMGIAGLVAMGIGALSVWLWPSAWATPGFGLLVVGFLAITFAAAPLLVQSVSGLASLFGNAGSLAAISLQRSPRRVWGTTVAVAAAVGLVVGVGEISSDGISTIISSLAPLGRPAFLVTSAPNISLPNHIVLPDALEARIKAIPGVGAVGTVQIAYASFRGGEVLLQGVQAGSADEIYANAPATARRAVAEGRGVVISTQITQFDHLRVGDLLTLDTPLGQRSLPIVASLVDFAWPRGSIALSLMELQSWYLRPGASWYQISLAHGADAASVQSALDRLAGHADYPAYVSTGGQFLVGAESSIRMVMNVLHGLEILALGVGALAILNTLVISVVQRRRELGILRAVGTGRRQLARVVLIEAVSIAIVGAVVSLPFGVLFQALGERAEDAAQGIPIPFRILPEPAIVAICAVVTMALIGSWWPARRTARLDVIEAIGYE
jgi:putative ABC transport system permease protein